MVDWVVSICWDISDVLTAVVVVVELTAGAAFAAIICFCSTRPVDIVLSWEIYFLAACCFSAGFSIIEIVSAVDRTSLSSLSRLSLPCFDVKTWLDSLKRLPTYSICKSTCLLMKRLAAKRTFSYASLKP